MKICKSCDRPFLECDDQTDIGGEEYPVCPYCGSSEFFTPSEYDGRDKNATDD